MATSLIESQRQSHLALENYESALVSLLCVPDESYKLHRERLGAQHRASYLLDRIEERSTELRSTYADPSGLRKQEMESIANGGMTEFYERLAKLKEYHRRFPEAGTAPGALATRQGGDDEERVDFSGLTQGGVIDGRDCGSCHRSSFSLILRTVFWD
jgi:splicing factor 3A subunit 3